jgi:carboxyl-terminal processing protease
MRSKEQVAMKQTRRLFWFVVLTVVLCALLGGVYGQRVDATSKGDESDVVGSLGGFTRVFDTVERNYADPVDPDKTILGPQYSTIGAIPGMLRTLDPHSSFFNSQAFTQLREEQEGRYYGVGMRIGQQPGKMGKPIVVVLQPIPGSPAFRAGLRPGDVIVKVDGKAIEGLESDRVASMLKGPKGTVVRVTVSREGYEEPLEFNITRDEISPRSVDDAFILQAGIAFIHLDRFNETTNEELSAELKRLSEKSLKGLILDLRGNPGGLLQEAVDVSDHFLQKRQLIVYHYGRHSREKRYYASHGDGANHYPIVVLIDRMTASAAEIVTGALQDHDRALVIGEPSFGKGLVQTVYPLSERTGLALTTAHYYTPSGRLIQRPYDNVSFYDYYYHDENAPTPHDEVRLTDGGREVYGGGGISPDVRFAEPPLTALQQRLLKVCPQFWQCGPFFDFGQHYLGVHKTIGRDFQADAGVLQQFKEFLGKHNIQMSEQDLKQNTDFLKSHIRMELVSMLYGKEEADRLRYESDPLVQRALSSFADAQQLMANAKKYVAEKGERQLRPANP